MTRWWRSLYGYMDGSRYMAVFYHHTDRLTNTMNVHCPKYNILDVHRYCYYRHTYDKYIEKWLHNETKRSMHREGREKKNNGKLEIFSHAAQFFFLMECSLMVCSEREKKYDTNRNCAIVLSERENVCERERERGGDMEYMIKSGGMSYVKVPI